MTSPRTSYRLIALSQGYWAVIDEEDYERVARFRWFAKVVRRKDGTVANVYAQREITDESGKRTSQKLHRFILGISDRRIQVDHRDHDGLNCRRGNMRISDSSQNQANKRRCISNRSGYKGVWQDARDGVYQAAIMKDGKAKHLGRYADPIKAAQAYDAAAIEIFGEFACLNFPR